MTPDLTTTNTLLGIMAAVSLLEAAAVVGLFAAGFLVFRRILQTLEALEQRQVAPAVARINDILDDVKGVTAIVRQETGRLDRMLGWVLDAIGRKPRRSGAASSRTM